MFFCFLFMPAVVYAESMQKVDGIVNITGRILNNTCVVAQESKSQIVNLGDVRLKLFNEKGETSTPVSFKIRLTKCGEAATGAVVIFSGEQQTDDPQLLAIGSGAGSAKNIGIAISDAYKNIIPIGDAITLPLTPETDNTLQFFANYIATGNVVPGVANADATFSVTWQ